jgi:hypothetical protein
VLIAAHAHEPRAGHAHEEYVHLVVNVLPDAPSRVETDQVGVQVTALFKGPDNPRASASSRGEFVQI